MSDDAPPTLPDLRRAHHRELLPRHRRIPPHSRFRGTGQAAFRKRMLAKTGGRCAVCGSTDRVVAHHPHQLQHGGTHEQEGMPLCHRHHQEVERRLRQLDRAR